MGILCKIKSFLGLDKVSCDEQKACCGGSSCGIGTKKAAFSEKDAAILKNADEHIVIGKIMEIASHPDPKVTKVRITQTQIGENKVEQVLCGGSNIEVGQIVPVACVGADFGGGFVIGEREIRGEVSRGMICSRTELGLSQDDEPKGGIWAMPAEFGAHIGMKIKDLA